MNKNPHSDNGKFHALKTDILSKKLIHKDSKIPVYLAKQQSTCLSLLMQGKTAKEIGIAMNLSYRTVQHYLVRICHLLGCVSTRELILAYASQFNSDKWAVRQLIA